MISLVYDYTIRIGLIVGKPSPACGGRIPMVNLKLSLSSVMLIGQRNDMYWEVLQRSATPFKILQVQKQAEETLVSKVLAPQDEDLSSEL